MLGKRLFIVEDGKKLKTKSIAYRYNCPYQVELNIRDKDDTLKKRKVHLGSVRVKFPFFNNQWFYLLIIKGKGKEPIVLLTTEEIKDEKDALRVLEIYLTRWRCEESFRFIKQGYNLEDIRLCPDEILQATKMSVDELKQEIAILLFQKEKLTLGQASRLAGMSQIQFQHLLASRQIPIHYDVAEFDEDLKTLQELGRL